MDATTLKHRTHRLLAAALFSLVVFTGPAATAATIERVSVSSDGEQALGGESYSSAISADGRFVAFTSTADNLVPGDTNGVADVFVRDRLTGVTERVSVSTAGAQADGYSHSSCSISGDGRYVSFSSFASNFAPGGTSESADIFLRDRLLGVTELISGTGTTESADDDSFYSAISADGRYVFFDSRATNLVPDDPIINSWDIFVRDRVNGTTQLVSLNNSGEKGNGLSRFPSVSADGRYVAFESTATNLDPNDRNAANGWTSSSATGWRELRFASARARSHRSTTRGTTRLPGSVPTAAMSLLNLPRTILYPMTPADATSLSPTCSMARSNAPA